MENKVVRVLLVEDNPGDARFIQEELSDVFDTHCSFIIAESLSQALKILEKETLDIILINLLLPDSSGIDIFLKVYKKSKSVPIVILSGNGDEKLAVNAVRSGAQNYLLKTEISKPLLLKTIKYTIERFKFQQELFRSKTEFQVISEDSNALIFITDPFGKYLYKSSSYKNLTSEIHNSIFDEIHHDDREAIKEAMQNMIKSGSGGTPEYRVMSNGNSIRSIKSEGKVIHDTNGKIEEIIFISHDITRERN